ncbi:hypothetical protein HYX12_04520 [Candidatus Woesearchaeota archaeon]|nr:hypothetical protein [Candidatus Woesearchaeota archaeon]
MADGNLERKVKLLGGVRVLTLVKLLSLVSIPYCGSELEERQDVGYCQRLFQERPAKDVLVTEGPYTKMSCAELLLEYRE